MKPAKNIRMDAEPFAEMVKMTGSLMTPIAYIASVFAEKQPKGMSAKDISSSAIVTGAHCALGILNALGCLNEAGQNVFKVFSADMLGLPGYQVEEEEVAE